MPHTRCQCEHNSHFPDHKDFHSGDAHEYDAPCEEVKRVKTLYGMMYLCTKCIENHLKGMQ